MVGSRGGGWWRRLLGTVVLFGAVAFLTWLSYLAIRSGGGLVWLGWLGAAAVAWVLIVLFPSWLVRVDTPENELLQPAEIVTARGENRDTIVKALGGVILLAGLFFTWQQQQSTNESLKATNEAFEASRFNDAVALLSRTDATLDARLGGIYTLEQVAKNPDFKPYAVQVISAYVREHAKAHQPTTPATAPVTPSTDIQAAVSVLGRNPWGGYYDLTGVDLRGADLTGLKFTNSVLLGANLSWANLSGVDLTGSDLSLADFRGRTILANTNLTGTRLYAAHFESVDLTAVVPTLTLDQLSEALIDPATRMSGELVQAVADAIKRSETVQPPPPDITISQPTNGAIVPRQPDISGTVENMPSDKHLWLVTRGPMDVQGPHYYPQGVTFPDYRSGIIVEDTRWTLNKKEESYYVGSEQDRKRPFEILIVLADEKANESFLEYLRFESRFNEYPGLSYLPTGAFLYSKVSVTRLPA